MVDELEAVGWGIGEEGRFSRDELGDTVECTSCRASITMREPGLYPGGGGIQLSK